MDTGHPAPRDVTSDLGPQVHFRSAWETTVGRFVEFASEGEAVHWHTALGDELRRNERMLVGYSDRDLRREETRTAVGALVLNRDRT